MGYMLGASEWGLATVSFFARRLTDVAALRVICLGNVVFHLASAAAQLYVLTSVGSSQPLGIWANITL
jgi:hypothetical protein